MTTSQALRLAVAAELESSTVLSRAALMQGVISQVYEWVRENIAEGGDDGRDSQERRDIAALRDAATDYTDQIRVVALRQRDAED